MKPTCHNHEPYTELVTSSEFPSVLYCFRMSENCGHWTPGGNAYVRPHGDDAGGKTFDWSECSDCKWK